MRKSVPISEATFPRSDASFQAGEEDNGQRSSTSVRVITRCAKEEKSDTFEDASPDNQTAACSSPCDRLAFLLSFFFFIKSNKNKNVEAALVQLYGYTTALLDALDAFLLGGRLLVRTVQSKSHGGKALGFAEGAGLEGPLLPADVPGDVERVALSVTEAVDDGAADASLLVDGLLEGLRLAPVPFQILALRHMQRFLAGLQHLVGREGRALPLPGPGARLRRLQLLLRFVGVVFVGMRNGALGTSASLRVRGGGEQPDDEEHTAEDARRVCHPWREDREQLTTGILRRWTV